MQETFNYIKASLESIKAVISNMKRLEHIEATGATATHVVIKHTNDVLHHTSYAERFTLIAHIKKSLYIKDPAPANNPYADINEDKFPNEITALHKLTNTLTLSDDYQDFIIHVTNAAIQDLSRNTEYVRDLLNWNHISNDSRLFLLQEFHNNIMELTQSSLEKSTTYPQIANAAQSTWISGFDENQHKAFKSCIGITPINIQVPPSHNGVLLNLKYRKFLSDAIDPINTIAHETAHVIEGLFSYIYGQNPQHVPEVFRKDAQLLFCMHNFDAYVGPRLTSVYRAQASEKLAHAAGNIAADIIKYSIIDNLKSKNYLNHPDYKTTVNDNSNHTRNVAASSYKHS